MWAELKARQFMFDVAISSHKSIQPHLNTFRFNVALITGIVLITFVAPVVSAPLEAPLPDRSEKLTEASTNDVGEKVVVDDKSKEAELAEAKKREKKRKASAAAALLLLVGILIMGMLVVYMTIRWGRHLKKSIHQPATCTAEVDDFWYLAKKQTNLANSATSNSKSDNDSTSEYE